MIRTRFLLVCLALLAATPAHASREARPTAIDHRVRTVMYQPDEVYKFVGHYGYQSSIEFAPDETIQTISMGDSTAWMLQPVGNRLFLKPVDQNATTNMTLITDKRTYLLELHGKEAEDIDDEQMTFIMRFIYGGGQGGGENTSVVSHYMDSVPLPDIDNEPGRYNLRYTLSGPETIAPLRIFDDGEFTYFEFRNKNADVPAFFMVDADGNESLINFRTRGNYIVVERVAERFTLRHGNEIVCVFNEAYPLQLRQKSRDARNSPPPPPQPAPPMRPQFPQQAQ